jgi:transposase
MKKIPQPPHHEIGVDVSKDTLDVFDGRDHWQVPNTAAGIRRLLKRCLAPGPPAQGRLTLESTGRYGHLLAAMALEAGLPVTMANARAVRDFARSTGRLAKTDRIDASMIARYAAAINPPLLDQSWKDHQAFVELHRRMRALIGQIAAQKASLHQYRQPAIRAEIRREIGMLEKRVAGYETRLNTLVAASPAMTARQTAMLAIKGVGKRTALALLSNFPELGRLNRQEAAALAGLAPMNRDSGTMRGKRCIQGGRALVRTALFQAALSASRYHPKLCVFYRNLRNTGKSARLALCAVARKLLIQINTTLKPIAQSI